MQASRTEKGNLVVLSGPSGAGKSTVVRELLRNSRLPLKLSVSATTRLPRPGEVEGREYFFLTTEEFDRRRCNNEFLECKEVFGRGHWYGTQKSPVLNGIQDGKWILLEIDVQGALTVFENYPEAISIFVQPGSMIELERRLRNRQTENEDAIRRRLEVAREEMAFRHHYKYEVINHTVDATVEMIQHLLEQHQ